MYILSYSEALIIKVNARARVLVSYRTETLDLWVEKTLRGILDYNVQILVLYCIGSLEFGVFLPISLSEALNAAPLVTSSPLI